MHWVDINLRDGIWSKPASSTKQKIDHVVPLSAPARQLLAEIAAAAEKIGVAPRDPNLGTYVFPGDGEPVTSSKSNGHGAASARPLASRA